MSATEQYRELAHRFTIAVRELASSPERLQNVENYLAWQFGQWLDKAARTPEGLTRELEGFADIPGRTVTNHNGAQIDWQEAVSLMESDLREQVHADLAPCTEQEFYDAYAAAYLQKYGEVWPPEREILIL